ncbi:MAG: succinate dehydrogenase/fumarate reductase iron-sulfur subunit [Nitrospirae bacterium]|nr:succinate dehydrogenase/fumarate reductase iron-sulfur subunit [Nitrospirota bacterium]
MRVTFRIHRFNPELDRRSHWEEYRLPVWRGMTVLDGLIFLRNQQDGTLSFRYSCQSAICGSCAMEINGTDKLACRTPVRPELERHGQVQVGPLPNFPVIKDLVMDMSAFWGKVQQVTPWLSSSEPEEKTSSTQELPLPQGHGDFHNVDACIMCGACVAACTSLEVSSSFLGPAALAKADRFVSDPREPEEAKYQRLLELEKPDGIWDCTRCNYCVEVCPKDVKPMDAIIRLRRAAIERGLTDSGGARHIIGFSDLIRREGRLNEALMPLKVVGFHPRGLMKVLALGFRMLLKGKVPNPLGHSLPGLANIRRIFRSFRSTLNS